MDLTKMGYNYQYPVGNTDDEPKKKVTITNNENASAASPTLPDHIYVRQEGSPQHAVIYDAGTGKPVENVTNIDVHMDRHETRVRVRAIDGERDYTGQDITIDAK